jgi:hypothetical protein
MSGSLHALPQSVEGYTGMRRALGGEVKGRVAPIAYVRPLFFSLFSCPARVV